MTWVGILCEESYRGFLLTEWNSSLSWKSWFVVQNKVTFNQTSFYSNDHTLNLS